MVGEDLYQKSKRHRCHLVVLFVSFIVLSYLYLFYFKNILVTHLKDVIN
jgi:hypothetical protein